MIRRITFADEWTASPIRPGEFLALADYLGEPIQPSIRVELERAVAIAGRGDRQLAQVALHRFLRTPVASDERTLG